MASGWDIYNHAPIYCLPHRQVLGNQKTTSMSIMLSCTITSMSVEELTILTYIFFEFYHLHVVLASQTQDGALDYLLFL